MHSGMMINAADQNRYGTAMSLLWGHSAFGIVFFFTGLLIDGYRLLIFRSRLVHDLDIEGIDADADLCAHREHIGGVYQPCLLYTSRCV